MRFLRMLLRTFKEAFKNIFRQRWLTLSAIVSIMLTLILTASSLILSMTAKRITSILAQGLTAHVYLKKEIPSQQGIELSESIKNIDNVKRVEFSTKDNQLDLVLDNYNEAQRQVLEEYKTTNPLNDVIIVTLHDPKNFQYFKNEILNKYSNNIENIDYQEKISNTVLVVFDNINKYMYFLIVIVGFISFIIITNTIRVTILARKTDIIIMRLVAASNWYIRFPFVIEGLLIGFISAVFASSLVLFTYNYFYPSLSSTFIYGNEVILLSTRDLVKNVFFITSCLGLFIGFIGSIFPVRKFLKS